MKEHDHYLFMMFYYKMRKLTDFLNKYYEHEDHSYILWNIKKTIRHYNI